MSILLSWSVRMLSKPISLKSNNNLPLNQPFFTLAFFRSNIDSSHEGHKTTNLVKSSEGGASLLYVVTFCSSLFGSEAGLSYCRNQLITKVQLFHGYSYEKVVIIYSVQLIFSVGLIRIPQKIKMEAKS